MNEKDQYVGDDFAIFVHVLVAENDTRSPKKLNQSQHEFIVTPADNKAEHFPDLGHTINNCSNESYTLKNKNNELHGKNILDTMRIISIMGDVRRCFQKYQTYINDKEKRK